MGEAVRERLSSARLYLCTGMRPDLGPFVEAVVRGGVDLVQLRQKGLEAREEMRHLEVVAEAARRHGALVSVNDRADVARAVGADVLHLGQGDLPVRAAREVVGPDVVIGVSTHDEFQVHEALADAEVDYFCVGPTWPTPTKPGRPAPGLALTRFAAGLAPPGEGKPWFAIGGIDLSTVDEVVAAGARRAVVVRVLTEAPDLTTAEAVARRLRQRLH